jgi:hypothetical protein
MRKYLVLFSLLAMGSLQANNISVTNVTLAGQNVSAGVNNAANYTYIEFDLTWENSWRTGSSPNNWDAAWIFVKFKTVGGSTWNHVYLAPSGHNTSPTTPTTSYSVQVGLVNEGSAHNATTNPAVGAFIYRSANGTGTFTAQDIRLKWFYRDNNVGDNDIIDVDVYAVEMAYVPDGAFWVGNNGSSVATTSGFQPDGSTASWNITSEGSFTACESTRGGATALWIPEYTGALGGTFTFPAAYPKGFNGYYCMKYEGSQQQWVDFLNSLTSSQQANLSTLGGIRNGISVSSGVYSTTLAVVPKQANSWPDVAAFLDWAGLRPMTEFEFEKACRGASSANNTVTDEFAWGTTNYVDHSGSLTNAGLTNERSTNTSANTTLALNNGSNALYQIRCGAFATSSSSRQDAGASFYGIMDLTGNGYETAVTVLSNGATGLPAFTGLHGNGSLTAAGYADVANWPGLSGGAVTLTDYSTIRRGGSWYTDPFSVSTFRNYGRVADRRLHNSATFNNNDKSAAAHYWNYCRGVRGVHTKPITSSETK